ncbi:MAG: hypothetical protein IGS50_02555 [Synechococcales cyanobacterium C42_A2020_086]|nr:hypothetical protein [Synechococcales cyanobacterium C42_A2020_086]
MAEILAAEGTVCHYAVGGVLAEHACQNLLCMAKLRMAKLMPCDRSNVHVHLSTFTRRSTLSDLAEFYTAGVPRNARQRQMAS